MHLFEFDKKCSSNGSHSHFAAAVPGNLTLFPIVGHHQLHQHFFPPQFAEPVWPPVRARGKIIRTLSSESVISLFVERLFWTDDRASKHAGKWLAKKIQELLNDQTISFNNIFLWRPFVIFIILCFKNVLCQQPSFCIVWELYASRQTYANLVKKWVCHPSVPVPTVCFTQLSVLGKYICCGQFVRQLGHNP